MTPLSNPATLIVPAITIYEVFKVILRESSENEALQAVVAMRKGKVIDLNTSLALTAARLSLEYQLPMADSIILATAHLHGATLWTQDQHFFGMPDVRCISKGST